MTYYTKALKSGQKEYRRCVAKGEYPFLPVLDEMVPLEKSVTGQDLGIIQIPTEFIVGTKTAGRTNDFARNFMPIADERSEFASKWETLCESHLEEGIREPIIAWEFLNRYYVQEGNKRVSVLKFFDSVSITARVKRILPTKSDNIQIVVYYELLDFYKVTGINFIEFSRAGSYKKLQKAVGKDIHEKWNDDEVKRFKSTYFYFIKCYKQKGGYSLTSTIGDAFLAFIQIYGYNYLKTINEKEMSNLLSKVWKEITLQQEEKQIDVKLDPETSGKKIIPSIKLKKTQIAFIYGDAYETSGWRKNHEDGRRQVQKVFEDKIKTIPYIVGENETIEKTIRKAIVDGCSVVFATEPSMIQACLKVAADYPNVKVLNCCLNSPHRLIHTYYPRMYEAKFISGAIAGSLTKTNKIGYICKYPIYGTIAEINAFARGMMLVNPEAKLYLEWLNQRNLEDVQNILIEKECDFISFRDYGNESENAFRRFGLTRVDGNALTGMALPIWNWSEYYKKIIEMILNGTFSSEEDKTNKSLNYYWGISAGVVDMIYSEKLPMGTRYLAQLIYQSFKSGHCFPFFEPEKTVNGTFIWEEDTRSLSIDEIINMDWLESNVEGIIPKYKDLDPIVQDIVNRMGINPARSESGENE